MDRHAGKIVLNGATSQTDRWLDALGGGYALVDNRSLAELLAFPLQFGRLINFYDLSDTIDGDWRPFFSRDPTLILASIAALDLPRAETAFLALEQRALTTKGSQKFESLVALFGQVIALARDVNHWLEMLSAAPERTTAQLLRRQIVAMIEDGLGAEVRRLVGYAEGARSSEALGRGIPLDLAGFLPIWDLACVCPDASIWRGRSVGHKIDHGCPYVAVVFFACLDAFSCLRTFALSQLAASLKESGHPPHIALYIAFANLFQTAQATVNTMSERYVRFYYHDILRETFRAAVPDHVYLTMTLAPDQGSSAKVPRGALFSAGADSDGIDILYAADKPLVVTPASITKLRTLRVARGAKPKGGGEVAERIFSSDISVADVAGQTNNPWATFGEPQDERSAEETTTLADVGFAISSPYLLLTGGERHVALRLTWSETSAQKLTARLSLIADDIGLAPDRILPEIWKAAFTLFMSIEGGWLKLDGYQVVLGKTDVTLDIVLPPIAPSVVASGLASDRAADGGSDPNPTLPTLKAYLKQIPVPCGSLDIYPLSLLEDLELTEWSLETNVSELSDLELTNTMGPVDAAQPFLFFGAPPVLGSFLDIGQPELFAKTLESLSIKIVWFDIPQNKDGFKGWYRDYVIGMDGERQSDLFDNTTFKVGICVVNPGRWDLAKDLHSADPAVCAESKLDLFCTITPATDPTASDDSTRTAAVGRLCASTVFGDLPFIHPAPTPSAYYDPAESTIRIQLTAPVYAFGDALYAQNVLSAVIGDLPDPTDATSACPARCEHSKILSDAAGWIGACIQGCDDKSPADYPQCMSSALSQCKAKIVEAALVSLLRCLAEAEGVLGRDRTAALSNELRALNDPVTTARATQIRQWIDRVLQEPAQAAHLLECFTRSLMLLGAVQCIEMCEREAGSLPLEKYKAAITAGLAICMQQLEQTDEDCCKDLKYPNPPWLPQATRVSLDYDARCSWVDGDSAGQFYHLLPFGGYAAVARADAGVPLLPRFPAGNLYIGLSGLVPPQSLTLLFQMTAPAGSTWSEQAPGVTWSCLGRRGWTELEPANILNDGTNGLQNSGILSLALPSFDPASDVLDPSLHWLGATVEQGASLVPMTSRIMPHALIATWQNNGSVAHLSAPLPPDTITSAVENLPAIDTITQPIESFGGRPPESGPSFQTWLGERLRHKDRALLAWDYERLVLESFPTVWKVQALAARSGRGASPGSVLIVVVPGPNGIDVMDPTAPVASIDLLSQIGASLEASISPFVTLEVANAVYVRIEVTALVMFSDEEDPGACIERLNNDLLRYLSPWPDGAVRAAKDGNYASEDEISEFVQTRPYVDAVLSLDFAYTSDHEEPDWYFLTSAKHHRIDVADADPADFRRSDDPASVSDGQMA